MVVYLKTRKAPDNGSAHQSPIDVAKIVNDVIDDIRVRGDDAVRVYSEKFDNWSPPSFKLSSTAIEKIIATVPKTTLEDIVTVQANVRTFALAQRKSLTDFEMEIRPGVHLGQKNIPINSVGA
jgi:histidinol dehydrogenase